jgi:RNA polymerase sigma-70 factor (ECF subfamily)
MPQDDLFEQVLGTFGQALDRLARSYEADPEKRRDLLQEIQFATWRSLATFDRQCSLRTWIYRVAHNVGASHVLKHRRANSRALVNLDDLEDTSALTDAASSMDRRLALDRLYDLIQRLQAIDREVILLYLEGVDAVSIGEITGISSTNVATKIHRIKKILTSQFTGGGRDGR